MEKLMLFACCFLAGMLAISASVIAIGGGIIILYCSIKGMYKFIREVIRNV